LQSHNLVLTLVVGSAEKGLAEQERPVVPVHLVQVRQVVARMPCLEVCQKPVYNMLVPHPERLNSRAWKEQSQPLASAVVYIPYKRVLDSHRTAH
jgi:hypothetical protein